MGRVRWQNESCWSSPLYNVIAHGCTMCRVVTALAFCFFLCLCQCSTPTVVCPMSERRMYHPIYMSFPDEPPSPEAR